MNQLFDNICNNKKHTQLCKKIGEFLVEQRDQLDLHLKAVGSEQQQGQEAAARLDKVLLLVEFVKRKIHSSFTQTHMTSGLVTSLDTIDGQDVLVVVSKSQLDQDQVDAANVSLTYLVKRIDNMQMSQEATAVKCSKVQEEAQERAKQEEEEEQEQERQRMEAAAAEEQDRLERERVESERLAREQAERKAREEREAREAREAKERADAAEQRRAKEQWERERLAQEREEAAQREAREREQRKREAEELKRQLRAEIEAELRMEKEAAQSAANEASERKMRGLIETLAGQKSQHIRMSMQILGEQFAFAKAQCRQLNGEIREMAKSARKYQVQQKNTLINILLKKYFI